jgi:hypothetical protein
LIVEKIPRSDQAGSCQTKVRKGFVAESNAGDNLSSALVVCSD